MSESRSRKKKGRIINKSKKKLRSRSKVNRKRTSSRSAYPNPLLTPLKKTKKRTASKTKRNKRSRSAKKLNCDCIYGNKSK